jgi:hypothetical protein
LKLFGGSLLLRAGTSALGVDLILELLQSCLTLLFILLRLSSFLRLYRLLLCGIEVEQGRIVGAYPQISLAQIMFSRSSQHTNTDKADQVKAFTATEKPSCQASNGTQRAPFAGQTAGQTTEGSQRAPIASQTTSEAPNGAQRTAATSQSAGQTADSSQRAPIASETTSETSSSAERTTTTSQSSREASDGTQRTTAATKSTKKTCHFGV